MSVPFMSLHVAKGLLAGTGLGALLTPLAMLPSLLLGAPEQIGFFVFLLPFIFLVSLVIWGVGMGLAGLPAWFVAHSLGARSTPVAMILGAFGVAMATALLFPRNLSSGFPLIMGVVGAIVGQAVRRVGYGGVT